jgi:phasin family protein
MLHRSISALPKTNLTVRNTTMKKITTNETIDMLNDAAGTGYEAMRQFGEINQRAFDRMVDKQFALMNLWMDAGMQQIKLATEAKGLQDLMTGNLGVAKNLTEKLIAENRATLEIAHETRDELRAWWEAGVADVTARASKVAQKVAA